MRPDVPRRRPAARGTLEGPPRTASPPDPSPAVRPAEPPAETTVPPGELEAPVTTWTDHTADRPISLTAPSGIDRAAHHRLDEAWLAAAWSHPTTRCFVVSGGQVLIDETADGTHRTRHDPVLRGAPHRGAPLLPGHRRGRRQLLRPPEGRPARPHGPVRAPGRPARGGPAAVRPRRGPDGARGRPGELAAHCTASARAAASAPSSRRPATSAAARPAAPSTTRAPTPP